MRPERPRADRLSFHEKRDLDTLPDRIAALEKEKARIEAALADPASFADRAAMEEASRRHGALLEEIAAAEERWLTLAARAEAIASR